MDTPKITKSAAIKWAGGSLTALANKLGVTVAAVSQWGENAIPDGRLWQLAMLGCPYNVEQPA